MQTDIDIKTDDLGNIDTAYYIARAHELRSECHTQCLSSLKKKLFALITFEFTTFTSTTAHR